MLIIGSHAMNHWLPNVRKIPIDLDVVGTYDEVTERIKYFGDILECYPILGGKKQIVKWHTGHILEAELAWPGSLAEELIVLCEGQRYAHLDVLYMLKMSHRFKKNSVHFKKTMDDIHIMRKNGAKIRPEHQDFYERRMKETYNYPHPNLNQEAIRFFRGDGIEYKYDHDWLHEVVKHFDKPMYKYYQKDGEEVACDKAKWNQLLYTHKLLAVAEECYVLALERSQIPHPGVLTPRQSFDIALEKVCTSITSGWFREFAWENYYAVQGKYKDDYVEKFKKVHS